MVSEGDVLFLDNGQLIPTLIELIPESLHFTGILLFAPRFPGIKPKEKCDRTTFVVANIALKATHFIIPPALLPLIT